MALAKQDGILTDSQEDPLQTQDPWAGMRGKPSSSASSGKQSSQLSIDKFENLQLHSSLQLQDGNQPSRSELSALDTSSSGFLFVHSTSLSDAMHAVRASHGPVDVITQRGNQPTLPEKILDAQVVVSPQHDLGSKKVMQVSLVLHRVEKLEVVQQAALLQIPTPQQFDVVLELYEEHCKDTVFSAWLKRGDFALILAESSSLLTPSATNNFRITGESPSRVPSRKSTFSLSLARVVLRIARSSPAGLSSKRS
eukprot:1075425-Amphidinium_carterae.2